MAAEQMVERLVNEKLEAVFQRINSNTKDIEALAEEVGSVKDTIIDVRNRVSVTDGKLDQSDRKLDLLLAMVEKTSTENGHGGWNEQKETPGFQGYQASTSFCNDNNLTF